MNYFENKKNKFICKIKKITLIITRNGAGFTLVEALVVIFVIGVISSIMIVNWRRNEEQYKLQRAAQQIAQTIREAQDFALNGKKMDWPGDPDGLVPRSYGVQFQRGSRTYFVYGDHGGNTSYQNPEDIKETITTLETGIDLQSIGTSNSIFDILFSVPDGLATFNPSYATGIIVIKRTGTTCPSKNCRSIIIKKTGEISIQ